MKIKRFLCGAILVFFALCSITTFLPVASAQSGQPAGNTENNANDNLIKYTPLAPLPGVGIQSGDKTTVDIISYARGIFRLAIGVAAALAVIMITIGGVEYIGSDTITSKESGREKINHALLGLFLAMGAWLILYTVNPRLVSLDFLVPEIPKSTDNSLEVGRALQAAKEYDLRNNLQRLNLLRGLPEHAVYKLKSCINRETVLTDEVVLPSYPYDTQSGLQTAKRLCENADPKGFLYPGNFMSCSYICVTQNDVRERINELALGHNEELELVPKDRPDVPGWYFGFYYSIQGETLERLRYYGPLTEERCRSMERAGTGGVTPGQGQEITQVYCREYILDDL